MLFAAGWEKRTRLARIARFLPERLGHRQHRRVISTAQGAKPCPSTTAPGIAARRFQNRVATRARADRRPRTRSCLGGQAAGPQNRLLAKRDTDYELWNRPVGRDDEPEIERPDTAG